MKGNHKNLELIKPNLDPVSKHKRLTTITRCILYLMYEDTVCHCSFENFCLYPKIMIQFNNRFDVIRVRRREHITSYRLSEVYDVQLLRCDITIRPKF